MSKLTTTNIIADHIIHHSRFTMEAVERTHEKRKEFIAEVNACVTDKDFCEILSRKNLIEDLSLNLTHYIAMVKENGEKLSLIDEASKRLKRILNIVTPLINHHIYIKLDTGGFPGYSKELGAKGEDHYPVLRITVKVDNKEPLDIPLDVKEDFSKINPATKKYLEKIGAFEEIYKSNTTIEEALILIDDYFKEHGIFPNNPYSNTQNILVCCNKGFILPFLRNNFVNVLSLCSPRVIDIDEVIAVAESVGVVPKMAFYADDPVNYLNVMQEMILKIGGVYDNS